MSPSKIRKNTFPSLSLESKQQAAALRFYHKLTFDTVLDGDIKTVAIRVCKTKAEDLEYI